jgi:L-amino acid N-acyltransferase YncA
MELRLADPRTDASAVARIYAPHVVGGYASFEEDAPSPSEMAGRMRRILAVTPWLVAAERDEVVGYAYASPHRDRPGYRWSVDVSAYVADAWRGRGVGTRLYRALLAILRLQGFVNAYAGIAQPNPASVQLHRSIGMTEVGTYHGVGLKGGTWRDVTWLEMALRERVPHPAEPVALPAMLDDAAGRDDVALALRTR